MYNKLKLFLLFLKLVMKLCWLFFMPRRSCECESKIFCFIFPFFVTKYTFFLLWNCNYFCNYCCPCWFFCPKWYNSNSVVIISRLDCKLLYSVRNEKSHWWMYGGLQPLLLSLNDVVQEFVSISSLQHIYLYCGYSVQLCWHV